jgi:predicted transposase YdaD
VDLELFVSRDTIRAALRNLGPTLERTVVNYMDIWLQKASEKARQEARQQGRQEGHQDGRQEGKALMLVELLEDSFGTLPPDLQSRVLSADAAALRTWGNRLRTAQSLESIFQD